MLHSRSRHPDVKRMAPLCVSLGQQRALQLAFCLQGALHRSPSPKMRPPTALQPIHDTPLISQSAPPGPCRRQIISVQRWTHDGVSLTCRHRNDRSSTQYPVLSGVPSRQARATSASLLTSSVTRAMALILWLAKRTVFRAYFLIW